MVDPQVGQGKLTFKGTKVPVSLVLDALRRGGSISDVLARHPGLTRPAVEEALGLALWALVGPYDYDALIDPQELVEEYGVNPHDILGPFGPPPTGGWKLGAIWLPTQKSATGN